MNETFHCTSADGLNLEAQLDAPEDPKAALVLCHPHPQMGGTMNAPLLVALVEDLNARGWAVLRFNFRGIGSSEGETGTGDAEVADALGAVAEMKDRFDLPLAIAGWSFGGAVAVRAATKVPELVGVVGIAPAIAPKPGITAGMPPASEVSLPGPLLVIVGANDELVDPTEAAAWTAEVGGRFVEMKGANHFFWGKYEALAEVGGDFLDGLVS
ncbi:MAG: uncharacterized protein QOG04_1148 [Actinomycetota bacterium]|jgi:alpha/beta superfamily hydrolase|nr:uncharacterized protein [Actinomycetota bacterium]